jgi:hypothetical protein
MRKRARRIGGGGRERPAEVGGERREEAAEKQEKLLPSVQMNRSRKLQEISHNSAEKVSGYSYRATSATIAGIMATDHQSDEAGGQRVTGRSLEHEDTGFILVFEFAVALLIILGLMVSAIHEKNHPATALLWCGAFLLTGAMVGFLFALPRVQARPPRSSNTADGFADDDGGAARTNLEASADWLTKILVGFALASLWRLPGDLRHFSLFVATTLSGDGNQAFVMGMILFFSPIGFFATYVECRRYFSKFVAAERAMKVQSLSKALGLALGAPVLVNYLGVICLRVRVGGEVLNARQIPIQGSLSRTVELEVWLQPRAPEDEFLAHAPVSIGGGETRAQAQFEIRFDSDSFRPDKDSDTVRVPLEAMSQSVVFRAVPQRFDPQPESPVSEATDRQPKNPVWMMLFQQNRLIQTIALDFELR